MYFTLHKKTGFLTRDAELRIYDSKGRPFYFFNRRGEVIYFNMPKGRYKTNNYIIEQPAPVNYSLPNLPKRERFTPLPERFNIKYGNNPNKCSVWRNEAKILFDNSFKNYPIPFIRYILGHELGHYYYKTERHCDTFANYILLKEGFNPSQIIMANELTLTGAEDRKNYCKHINRKA